MARAAEILTGEKKTFPVGLASLNLLSRSSANLLLAMDRFSMVIAEKIKQLIRTLGNILQTPCLTLCDSQSKDWIELDAAAYRNSKNTIVSAPYFKKKNQSHWKNLLIVCSNLPYHSNLIDIIFLKFLSCRSEMGSVCAGRVAKPLSLTDPARARALPPPAFPLLFYNAQRTFKVSAQERADTSQ